jgi:hypothetical protein
MRLSRTLRWQRPLLAATPSQTHALRMPKLNGTMDRGKGLNVGKGRPGSNRNVSGSVPSLRPSLDTRRPVVIPKLVHVSGVRPKFAAFLPEVGLPDIRVVLLREGMLLGNSAKATKWFIRQFSSRSLAPVVH